MGVARLAARFEVESFPPVGQPHEFITDIVITCHVRQSDLLPLGNTELAVLSGAMADWWRYPMDDFDAVRDGHAADVKLADITARRIAPTVSAPIVSAGYADNVGTDPGQSAPAQLSVLIGLRTQTATRRGRGRIYMPAPVNGRVGETGKISILTLDPAYTWGPHLAARFRAVGAVGPVAGPWTLIVWSRASGTGAAVTHFEVPDHIAIQRRRKVHPWTYEQVGLSGGLIPPIPFP